jgi:hypothetical protein
MTKTTLKEEEFTKIEEILSYCLDSPKLELPF